MRKGSVEVLVAIFAFAIIAGFCLLMGTLNGIRDDVHALTKVISEKGADTATQTAEAVEPSTDMSVEGSYKITVTADENFVKAGNYDWVSPNINPKNFDVKENRLGDVEVSIIHIFRPMSSEDITKWMNEKGFKPGNLLELCALGAKFPDLQRQYPIVALGSSCVVGGYRAVPYLDGGDSLRYLGLDYRAGDWDAGCRFLAVRK